MFNLASGATATVSLQNMSLGQGDVDASDYDGAAFSGGPLSSGGAGNLVRVNHVRPVRRRVHRRRLRRLSGGTDSDATSIGDLGVRSAPRPEDRAGAGFASRIRTPGRLCL